MSVFDSKCDPDIFKETVDGLNSFVDCSVMLDTLRESESMVSLKLITMTPESMFRENDSICGSVTSKLYFDTRAGEMYPSTNEFIS